MCSSTYIFTAKGALGFSCCSSSFEVDRRWKCTICRSYTKRSKVSWHSHQGGPGKVLLNIFHPSSPLTLNLPLDSFEEGIGVINSFVVV